MRRILFIVSDCIYVAICVACWGYCTYALFKGLPFSNIVWLGASLAFSTPATIVIRSYRVIDTSATTVVINSYHGEEE